MPKTLISFSTSLKNQVFSLLVLALPSDSASAGLRSCIRELCCVFWRPVGGAFSPFHWGAPLQNGVLGHKIGHLNRLRQIAHALLRRVTWS